MENVSDNALETLLHRGMVVATAIKPLQEHCLDS